MVAETVLREQSIVGFLGHGTGVEHVHSLGSERIALPPLATGRHFFDIWPVRELPDQGLWAATHYDSFAPPVFVLRDVLVHASAGILVKGDKVITESLVYTNPREHAYRALLHGIALSPGPVTTLAGTHVSLLAAGCADYRHSMLNGLARLMSVPANYLLGSDSVLVPAGAVGQTEALELLDLLPSLSVRHVAPSETLRVETLVLPLSVCGDATYHPCLRDFYRRLSGNVASRPGSLPRRLYIDHRGTGIRPLRMENAMIAALGELGFVPVRPEAMSLADRIRLFRQADAIVSPHGTSLVDLGYCRPGCLVVELLMDACVDWSFRNLAALARLNYDCVLGRAQQPWGDLDVRFHRTQWDISVNHVVAAVAQSLGHRKAA